MLERLPSRLRPIVEPVCPKCKVSMYGVNLIPGFAVFSNRIFQCFKCGHMESVFPRSEATWRNTSTERT